MSTPGKTRTLLLVSLFGVTLAGCISTPQTKALITPIGVVGVHSFAPPHQAPREGDFEQRLAQQRATGDQRLISSGAQTRG